MQNMMTTLGERLRTTPVSYPPMARPDMFSTVTSGKAGMAMPLGFIPLLREDWMETSNVRCMAYMDETAELLINSVNCVFSAYAVPRLAFDRFEGSMDALNRADMKKQEKDGSTIPFYDAMPYGTAGNPNPFFVAAGLHAGSDTATVNADYWEAYKKVFEYRCRQRSEALWAAVQDDYTSPQLLPAFFDNPQMGVVKPSFDSGQLEGIVPLTVVAGEMPVRSVGSVRSATAAPNDYVGPGSDSQTPPPAPDGVFNWANKVWAELAEDGITVSLANIEMAKETQAFARVRNMYSGIDDDALVDLLMSGVEVPHQYLSKPILLDRRSVPFGMTQRYSSDADALEVSATRGVAGATLRLRVPRMNTGAVVVVICEVVPEQFWERSKDYHFLAADTDRRPDRLLDQLDPQAVEIVENAHADVRHSDPEGIFGYAPLNHAYVRRRFNVGGKFFKPDPAAPWSQDRNRIWASEPVDPTLSKEFFLATDLPDEIFMSSNEDNFEFSAAGQCRIVGNTFIGPLLREATDDYQSIIDRIDTGRIDGTPVAQLAEQVIEDVDQPEAATAAESENESE